VEVESIGGAANNAPGNAENLAPSNLMLSTGGSRMAVLGESSGEDDY
jgi:hypothetical protein